MWSDTLFHSEQLHLLRLLLWAGLSIVGGTTVGAVVGLRRIRSPFLRHFGGQLAGWGVVVAAIAGAGWHRVHMRDLSGAARLERLLWLNVGLDAGYVAVGAVLALSAWMLARRMAVVGAGMGIAVHGLALLVIDLQFAAVVSR
ncbi:MAG: hypothetical protein ABJF01_02910 [bacterium]